MSARRISRFEVRSSLLWKVAGVEEDTGSEWKLADIQLQGLRSKEL